MQTPATARLTQAQRVALRMFMERKTAKQIALELGITPKAVELRLKGARDAFGVATSAEAARLLATVDQQQQPTYRETLGGTTEVADTASLMVPPPIDSTIGHVGARSDRKVLSEARIAFAHEHGRWLEDFEWPFPSRGDKRNDLSFGARLLWPIQAIFAIGVSIGTLVICGSLLALAGTAVFRLLR
jgi:DNA-binding CsgD family transcriptional regulator